MGSERSPNRMDNVLTIVRHLFSCTLVFIAIFAVIAAIATKETSFFGIPQAAQGVLLVICLWLLGIVEGLQMCGRAPQRSRPPLPLTSLGHWTADTRCGLSAERWWNSLSSQLTRIACHTLGRTRQGNWPSR